MVSGLPTEGAGQRPDRVLIFDRDPKQAEAYSQLFVAAGHQAVTASPTDDLQRLCERLQPDLVLFDMAFWEADTALVFGILNLALGFARPVIIGLTTMDVQSRRARRFGADSVWVRGVDDAVGLLALAAELVDKRRSGKLVTPSPRTPL